MNWSRDSSLPNIYEKSLLAEDNRLILLENNKRALAEGDAK